MLSKLLSNISAGNAASSDEALSGNGGKEGGMSSSEQVFKSLLQSLQNEGSSGQAKQQLLTLSEGSSEQEDSAEGKSMTQNIFGGSFTVMGEEAVESLEQADQNILKELQKEFQNIKAELSNTNGESETSSEEGEGKTPEQKTVTEESDLQEGEASGVQANEHSNSDETQSRIIEGSVENNQVAQKAEVQSSGESKKVDTEKESTIQSKSAEAKVSAGTQAAGETVASTKENAETVGKKVDGESQQDQKNDKKVVSAKDGEKSELSQKKKQEIQKTDALSDKKVTSQSGSIAELQDESVATTKSEESSEKTSQKAGIENRESNINNQTSRLGNAARFVDQQMQPDAMRQPKERSLLNNQKVTAGGTKNDLQADGGQTAKTELTEQQKKVMNSFLQKNSTANISAKGLEMKGVQQDKGKKSTQWKSEAKDNPQGLGKQSSEGRNKLLSRLGISSVQAQKQAKPLDMQNFSGVSVGESNASLAEQKVSWEEQVTKTMDSASEKESKAPSGSGSMRLGQMPVANVALRKKILPGLTQNIQKAASSAKENAGNWQKHTFTLDDGKNIQLSVRESKGVLQVKMGSMNLDLSKLLQQNLQQIREHLKQEFGSDIDLQFDNQQQGEESQLSEDTEQSNHKRNYHNNFAGEGKAVEDVENISTKTVRNFGYNQMEWTA